MAGGRVFGISVTQSSGTVVIDRTAVEFFNQTTTMQVANNGGPVVFDGVDYMLGPWLTYGMLAVSNSAQVSFHGGRLPTMTVQNARVAFDGAVLTPYGFTPGLRLVSGSVVVQGGRITGGATASFPVAESGIVVEAGELSLTGGALIEPSPAAIVALPRPGIATTGGSIRIDPSVVVLGLPISGPATVTSTIVPSLAITHGPTTLNVTTHGEPASARFTFAGLPVPAYATPWGEAWLLPSDPILDVSVLPASGVGAFTRSFAVVPRDFVLVLQSVILTPAGSLVVGAPLRFAWH
ncbi:MAG: hypothetical protein ABIP94_25405 [Planctomycetota bacterium]